MDQFEILRKRIAANRNPAAVALFFRLLKIFLEDLRLGPENPKLSLTIPSGQKRFVVNLNSRYAIALEQNGTLGFLIETDDYKAVQRMCRTTVMFRFRKAGKEDDYFLKFPFQKLTDDVLDELIPHWLKACKNLETRMSRSPYRKFHSREFYQFTMDEGLQNVFLRKGPG